MRPSRSPREKKLASMRPKLVGAIGAAAGAMIGIILAIIQGGVPGYAAGSFSAGQVVTPNGINFSAVIGPWGNEALMLCFGATLGWICGLLAVKVLGRVLAWRGIDLSDKSVRARAAKCVALVFLWLALLASLLSAAAPPPPSTQVGNEQQVSFEQTLERGSQVAHDTSQAPKRERRSPQQQALRVSQELHRKDEEYKMRSSKIHDSIEAIIAIIKVLKQTDLPKRRKKGG